MKIYRNLLRNCWSIQDKGLVIAHAKSVLVNNAKFIVQKKGNERVRREKRRMVHAYVQGEVKKVEGLYKRRECFLEEGLIAEISGELVTYNPFENTSFVIAAKPVTKAKEVFLGFVGGRSKVIAKGSL